MLQCYQNLTVMDLHIAVRSIFLSFDEPADLTCTPPPKRSRVGSYFSHRCLVLPNFFP